MWAVALFECKFSFDIIVVSLRYVDSQRALVLCRPRFLEGWLYRYASIGLMENVGSLNVLTTRNLGISEFVHLPVHCGEVLVDFGVELHQVFVFGHAMLLGLLLLEFGSDGNFNTTLWPLSLFIT